MANESADGDVAEAPDAVREWLSSIADERGMSEAELLQSLVAERGPAAGGGAAGDRDVERVEQEFRDLVQDVRERIVQVKRETDEKAPAEHSHHDLRNSVEQLGHEVGALEAQVEQLDERLSGGFENYEEILTYLTDSTDELNRRLGRLASAVVELRERVGEAARDEVRRTALTHLTDTANRHGIDTAKCGDCGETVDLSLLVEPRCPHCDSAFSTVEPKSGFFRSSVLHTGTLPALESAGEAPASGDDALEALVDAAAGDADEAAPDIGAPTPSSRDGGQEAGAAASEEEPADEPATRPAEAADEPDAEVAAESETADQETTADAEAAEPADTATEKADGDLQSVDGVGPAYAERLRDAGIDGLLALAVADPEELAAAIDVPASTVADWVEQADARTGAS